MNEFEWSDDLVEILIFLWQQHEVLYKVNPENFRNKEKRNNAMCSIYRELKKLSDHITLGDIELKMHSLSAQFAEEFRQINGEDGNSPNLWCYDQLMFLEDRVLTTSSKPEIDTVILNPTKKSSMLIQNSLQPLQNLLKRKLENKYDWLGQQLVFKMSKIKDEDIRKATVRAIKSSLENIDPNDDKMLNDNEDENAEGDDGMLNDHGKDKLPDSSKKVKQNSVHEEIELNNLQNQVMALKQLIENNLETEAVRLGKLVSEKVNKINDGRAREETAWAIQCILHESVKKDKMLRQGNQEN